MSTLGVISYGVYIYHYPIQKVVAKFLGIVGFEAADYALTFAMISFISTIVMASLSYLLLERPFMEWVKQKRGDPYSDRAKPDEAKIVSSRSTKLNRPRWTKVSITFNQEQKEYLDGLSLRENRSISGAARNLIAEYHFGLMKGKFDLESLRKVVIPTADNATNSSPYSVNLRSKQAEFLRQVSDKFETNLSYAAQIIINNMMGAKER